MHEVGVAREFEAAHQLEESPSAGDEHDHRYRVDAIVRGETLGTDGMLLDLDQLGAALDGCLAELESANLETLAIFAGRSTTVEVVSLHIWEHLRDLMLPAPQLDSLRVTVHESAEAWASIDLPLHG